jgi:hypothetical protein
MVLETGIFASQAIWLWRVRHVRREAKKAGKTYDAYIAENPSKNLPWSESSETIVDVEACHEPKGQDDTASAKATIDSKEKPDAVSETGNVGGKAPPTPHVIIQKWRSLVLRPSPEVQS